MGSETFEQGSVHKELNSKEEFGLLWTCSVVECAPGALNSGTFWALKGRTFGARAPRASLFQGAFGELSIKCRGLFMLKISADDVNFIGLVSTSNFGRREGVTR